MPSSIFNLPSSLVQRQPIRDPAADALHAEAGELIAIFVTMINRTKESGKVKPES